MNPAYTCFTDLAQEAVPPVDGILSRTLYNDERTKAVIFGFGAGQELSEHTSSKQGHGRFENYPRVPRHRKEEPGWRRFA